MRSLNAWLDALVQNRNETGIVEYVGTANHRSIIYTRIPHIYIYTKRYISGIYQGPVPVRHMHELYLPYGTVFERYRYSCPTCS